MPSYPVKLSIVIPFFNAERTLDRTLKSILFTDSAGVDFEIIGINDGSTDKSSEIFRNYERRDERLTLVDCPNRGPGYARNRGIIESHGKYLFFIDADDELTKNFFAVLYVHLCSRDIDMLLFSQEIILNEREPLEPAAIDYYLRRTTWVQCAPSAKMLSQLVSVGGCSVQVSGYVTSRELWSENALWFPEFYYEDEVPFLMLLWYSRRSTCISDQLVRHHVTSGSITKSDVSKRHIKGVLANASEFSRMRASFAKSEKTYAGTFQRYCDRRVIILMSKYFDLCRGSRIKVSRKSLISILKKNLLRRRLYKLYYREMRKMYGRAAGNFYCLRDS